MAGSSRVLKGHAGPITSLAYFSDGLRLASGSSDNTIRVWNVAKDQPEKVLKTDMPSTGLAIAPDGDRLAMCKRTARGRFTI